ncbi:hypothetical protein PF010_g24163 [Phytophthora fragariae]|uniref:Uncharacterized protein n=1 Tax=Phytophthora fragariae TaxID=53985 RepID=A0A6A4BT52_9STRA|nr:hypothetical protein PF003_g35064 [Phytophthora fragariae]KAE8923379.1 hypothetical protein PF009_g26372 [Phytophthora fragariae]KAE8976293.1 hypothetical protein PF011_g24111 [Phytophthora fragariae]KAE9073663.1 hypothetical protein PF007_g25720 [Phytophthora fragariae]KAE9075794.1 hypothetical protein PF010_g24163 [Phytophthora fragariae]
MLRFLAVVRSVAPAPWAGWFLTTNPLPLTAYKWLFGCKSCSFLQVSKTYPHMVRPVITLLAYGHGFEVEFAI